MEILIFDEETKRHALSQLWESVLPFLTISHHLCALALFSSWIITYQVDDRELVVGSGDLLTTGLLLSSPSTPLSGFTSFRPVVTKACLHSGITWGDSEITHICLPPPPPPKTGFNWSGRSFSVWKLWGLFQWSRCADQFGNHHLRPLPKPPSFSTHSSSTLSKYLSLRFHQSLCCFVLFSCVLRSRAHVLVEQSLFPLSILDIHLNA